MNLAAQNRALLQAALLLMGAAVVLLPLMAQAGQDNPVLEGTPEAELHGADLTELGLSRVDAIFILREESRGKTAGDAER
jgi:hypothetical protein